MKPLVQAGALLTLLLLLSAATVAQVFPDPGLVAAIRKIKAVDNHCHALPWREIEQAQADRPDPLGKTPFPYPVRLRVDNPEYVDAWRALYGYAFTDMTTDHARGALRTKLRYMKEKGTSYPAWVLDQAGIDVALVNMPHLGPGQTAPRHLWVPRADNFLFPFDRSDESLGWFRSEIGLDSLPPDLGKYVGIMSRTLERWKKEGAVAIKFGIAYARPLDFASVSPEEASPIFDRLRRDATLSANEQKAMQDFLFRTLARQAGRVGLAVHIHCGMGADPYFNVSGSNPMLLEPTFNDESLRNTKFVMIHGGWPFEREAGVMMMKPNVYADFSSQTFLRSTEALSEVLRAWLEWYPEKVLFGTDAYPDDTPLASWEEKIWLTTRTAREALARALTRMMKAGQITRARAEELARMVLRDNALRLYGLQQSFLNESPQQKDGRLAWWREARFGMFIHWGPISLKGTEISWSRQAPRRGIDGISGGPGEVPAEVYDNLYKEFNPVKFNADTWVSVAKAAGMKYMVLTAKHCDGFCLWHSRVDDYSIAATPFKRDICAELSSAAQKAKMKIGWYYSPMDWRDPDTRTERNDIWVKKMQGHLRELFGNYGKIDLLWFDTDAGPAPWDQPNTYALVRTLQPGLIINNRLDMGSREDYDNQRILPNADYATPEQRVGVFDDEHPWETCMTIGTQWSWKPDDTIKTAEQVIGILTQCVTGDGNLLLNVGPMPSGEIEPRQVAVLKEVGGWLKEYGESIYGTRGGPFRNGEWGGATRKGSVIYLHIMKWTDGRVVLPKLNAGIKKSITLTGGKTEVRQTQDGTIVTLLEKTKPNPHTIVKLELDRDIASSQ